ncbi:hypothetical protein Tco_1535190, partial [Tanacetum coccineum]
LLATHLYVTTLSSHVLLSHRTLLYVPGAYGQTLEALLSQPAASENKSHIHGVVSE